jgi:rhamnose utilization protein RhaD (predicted bifunctional aldolase and dehydrogenase)
VTPAELTELVAVCRAVGDDLALVQAGGGNASVKTADDRSMWIKSSGARMREVSASRGAVEVDVAGVRRAVHDAVDHDAYVREVGAAAASGADRPSLETGFHALLDRTVLHTHSLHAAALGCVDGGATALVGLGCAWVPYATPGLDLARAIGRAIERHRADRGAAPELLVLERHGLIASAATGDQAVRATRRAAAAAAAWLAPLAPDVLAEADAPPGLTSWASGLGAALGPTATRAARFSALHRAADDPARWLAAGPLVPDDVVFGVGEVGTADPAIAPAAWLATVGPRPDTFAVSLAGLGVVVSAPRPALADALEEMLLGHVLIRRLVAGRGPVRAMPADAIAALAAMESERHRRAVATPHGGACRS